MDSMLETFQWKVAVAVIQVLNWHKLYAVQIN